jgi:hypothetical protein
MGAAHAVGLFITCEVFVRTFTTFNKWRTIYFWYVMNSSVKCTRLRDYSAFVAACFGLFLSLLALDLSVFVLPPDHPALNTLHVFGSIVMTTGFMLVMWSRLHIVMPPNQRRLLRLLLVVIVVVVIGIFTPEIAAAVLKTTGRGQTGARLGKIGVFLQMYTCSATYVVLVGCYIYFLRRYAKDIPTYTPPEARKAIANTYRVLLVFSAVLVIDKVVLTILLALDLMLVRLTALAVLFPVVLSFEFVFIRELVRLSKVKSDLLARGNMSMSLGQAFESRRRSRVEEVGDKKEEFCDEKKGTMACNLGEPSKSLESDEITCISEDQSLESRESLSEASKGKSQVEDTVHRDSIDDLERQYLGKTSM